MHSLIYLGIAFALGLLLNKAKILPPQTPQRVNAFIINIALPAIILLRIPNLSLNHEALLPIAVAWLVIIGSATTIYVLGRYMQWPKEVTGALLLVVPLSNSAYLGLPLIKAVYGVEALPYAILYDQFGNFIGVSVYAAIIIAAFSPQQRQTSWQSIAKTIISFPPFIALILGLLIEPSWFPQTLESLLTVLASTMGPLCMLIIGVQMRLSVPQTLIKPLAIGLGIKLFAAPMLVWIICHYALSWNEVTHAALYQAAMPPMITAGLLAINAGLSERLVVAITGIGTILCLITLPLFYSIS